MARQEKKKASYKLPVYKIDGKPSGEEIELNPEVFGARINKRLFDIVLTGYGNNQRRGTHDTKVRKEVRGGGKKPWKQKGTGRARVGSIRSPLWRGGGTVFGPHPRDYSVKIPKDWKRQALVCALSMKFKEENIIIAEDINVKEAKTKEAYGILKALDLDTSRTICILPELNENFKRATNNIKDKFLLKESRDVSAYHIARRRKILIDKEAIKVIEERALKQLQRKTKDKKEKVEA